MKMMKKFSGILVLGLSVMLAGSVSAQKKPDTMQKMPTAPKMATGQKVSYTGTVKDAPTATGFTLMMKKKSVTVTPDKGVTARDQATGKFMAMTAIKPGSRVTVVGTLTGTTLTAKSVTVNAPTGKKTTPTPKMTGKMGETKK